MHLTLETTIGTVNYMCVGHFIHVQTEQEAVGDFLINLWDDASKKLRIELSIDEVFLEVAKTLRNQFPQFSVDYLRINCAPLRLLMESMLVKGCVEITRETK